MFEGKVACVTGSADGLGKAAAMMLAKGGADLVLCDLLGEKLEQTNREIEAMDRKSLACRVDVTVPSEVEKMVEEAVKRFGRIDFLVNNAGGPFAIPRDIEAVSDEDWHRVIHVNLTGTFVCCRAVVPVMKRHQFGSIVSVSSSAARDGGELSSPAYAAAKAGVIGLTRNLARQLSSSNIRVNAVAPGLTLTSEAQKARVLSEDYRERRERSFESALMKRYGEPREIASGICFLLSEEASFITGVTLDVSGGRYFA
ncbi:MAG: SDR family oxidoreductase [Desulfobacteraceae bacterium]|nr:MAG: SDR family oxidoreductase [Desulfobacteraceae bacterium]